MRGKLVHTFEAYAHSIADSLMCSLEFAFSCSCSHPDVGQIKASVSQTRQHSSDIGHRPVEKCRKPDC